ncbi:MAG: hypothetical protein WDW38_008590 [Sanguina aurantia]
MAIAVDADAVFRAAFTACSGDMITFLLDVRPYKDFKRSHINATTFSIRLSSNGKVLADYSQASYNYKWSNDCWWGKRVIVYGEAGLTKEHPVIAFLANQGKCSSLLFYKEGFDAFSRSCPFLCSASVATKSFKKYPSQIIPGLLYLGDWDHAAAVDRLEELGISRVVTVHNNPETLKLPSHFKHYRAELPDIESADISSLFNATYEFIEQARAKGQGVLVHCGAGVSRSATLVMMYLMRHNGWSAGKARELVEERRSLVMPNDGFWRTLCALEGSLGIKDRKDRRASVGETGVFPDRSHECPHQAPRQPRTPLSPPGRSNPDAGSSTRLEDSAAPTALSADAAGARVAVQMVSAKDLRKRGRDGEGEGEQQQDPKRSREGGGGGSSGAGPAGPGGKGSASAGGPDSHSKTRGFLVVLQVSKPEGEVGELRLGPMHMQRCVFGRQPGLDVVLEHASVSRQHAHLAVDARGEATLTDLGSQHGTQLDGVWVKANQAKTLKVDSKFKFGASTRGYRLLRITDLSKQSDQKD